MINTAYVTLLILKLACAKNDDININYKYQAISNYPNNSTRLTLYPESQYNPIYLREYRKMMASLVNKDPFEVVNEEMKRKVNETARLLRLIELLRMQFQIVPKLD